MERTELPERITRIEENMATKEALVAVERDLKEQIVGVKSDLQKLDAKIDLGLSEIKTLIANNTHLIEKNALETESKFDELKGLVQTTKLKTENDLLKKIIRWGLAAGIVIIPAVISLFSRIINLIDPPPITP